MRASTINFSILWCGVTEFFSTPCNDKNTTCCTSERFTASTKGLKYRSTSASWGGRTSSTRSTPVRAASNVAGSAKSKLRAASARVSNAVRAFSESRTAAITRNWGRSGRLANAFSVSRPTLPNGVVTRIVVTGMVNWLSRSFCVQTYVSALTPFLPKPSPLWLVLPAFSFWPFRGC